HKSLERSFSLIVLANFFPSGGTGSWTSLPILRASQNPHIQSPSGTSFNGGFRHFKWKPPKQSSHSIITALPDLKHTLHSSTSGSSSSELASSLLLTYTSSPTSNSPPSYTTFL
ncbi:Orc, partial [Trema orientale]